MNDRKLTPRALIDIESRTFRPGVSGVIGVAKISTSRPSPPLADEGPVRLRAFASLAATAVFCLIVLSGSAAQLAAINPQPSTPLSQPSDLLQFLDGASMHGHLRAMDTEQGVQWDYPAARQIIKFKPNNIAWIKFENAKRVATQAGPLCWFQFNNGDEVFGSLKSLDGGKLNLETWFGGDLEAPRKALQAITFFSKSFAILYEGPTGVDGWKLEKGPKGWQYRDGAFVASSVGILGRDLKLSGSSSVEFDLAWSGHFSLSFILYAESIERFDYSTSCYMFHLAPGYMNLQRVQSGAGVMSLGPQVQIPDMLKKNKMRLEIRSNKEEATITVLADGVVVSRWKDQAGFAAKGSGIVFSSQMEGPAIKISNMKVSEWDGAFEPRNMTNAPAKDDLVFLANRDKVVGSLQSIRDGKLTFAVSQTTLDIPMQRVTQIVFEQPETNAPVQIPWEIRAHVAGGGTVSFHLEKWGAEQVLGKSVNFGQMALNPQSIRQIQFNAARSRTDSDDLELGREEIWELDE